MISDNAHFKQWFEIQYNKGIKEGHPPSVVAKTVFNESLEYINNLDSKPISKPSLYELNGFIFESIKGENAYYCEDISLSLPYTVLLKLKAKTVHTEKCRIRQTRDGNDCDCGAFL